jgi:uncharacterized membrane protein
MTDIREASLEHDARGLPGGPLLQALPFAILAAVAAWVWNQYGRLPPVIPLHWNLRGQVDRTAARTVLAVFFPLAVGVFLCALLLLIAVGMRRAAPRSASIRPSLRLLFAGELLAACACSATVVAIATGGRFLAPIVVGVLIGAAAVVGMAIALTPRLARQESLRNPSRWHSAFYYAPEDPALWVPKRFGYGYTLNFGHRGALVGLAVSLLFIGGIVAVAVSL